MLGNHLQTVATLTCAKLVTEAKKLLLEAAMKTGCDTPGMDRLRLVGAGAPWR